jgi:hypothetical protein
VIDGGNLSVFDGIKSLKTDTILNTEALLTQVVSGNRNHVFVRYLPEISDNTNVAENIWRAKSWSDDKCRKQGKSLK